MAKPGGRRELRARPIRLAGRRAPAPRRARRPLETATELVMGAFGGRGILLAAAESGGVELATRTDAMLTRTTSDAVARSDGNLAASEADAHRLRLVLEGSRGFTWTEGRRLTPTVELGLRHDWGDAETGFGLEVGGRVQYADPGHGLTIDAAVRGLLAHEDSAYQEWGASGTVRVAPGGRRPGPVPDALPDLGRDRERGGRPVGAADHGGSGAAGHPPRPGWPGDRGSGLWLCRLRDRARDPVCRDGAHRRTGPDVPGRNTVTSGRRVGTRPRIERGRRPAGIAWGPTCESGDTPASGMGVLRTGWPSFVIAVIIMGSLGVVA